MRHTTENMIEYGRFRDPSPHREYVVTSSLSPNNVRVWALEAGTEPEMVCTIYNMTLLPLASWNSRWIGNMRHWKSWLIEQATDTYFKYRQSPPQYCTRDCDG